MRKPSANLNSEDNYPWTLQMIRKISSGEMAEISQLNSDKSITAFTKNIASSLINVSFR